MDRGTFESQVAKSYLNWNKTGDTEHLKDIGRLVQDYELGLVMAQQEINPSFIQVADDCEMWG